MLEGLYGSGRGQSQGTPGGTQGTGPVLQGWGSVPREQGCESHPEYEGQQGWIPQPMSWDTIPG